MTLVMLQVQGIIYQLTMYVTLFLFLGISEMTLSGIHILFFLSFVIVLLYGCGA